MQQLERLTVIIFISKRYHIYNKFLEYLDNITDMNFILWHSGSSLY
jgi:hypothetical protein